MNLKFNYNDYNNNNDTGMTSPTSFEIESSSASCSTNALSLLVIDKGFAEKLINNDHESDSHCIIDEKLKCVDSDLEMMSDLTKVNVDNYLGLIHTYNEVKDTAQELIGHFARLKGTTTKQIYNQYFPDLSET